MIGKGILYTVIINSGHSTNIYNFTWMDPLSLPGTQLQCLLRLFNWSRLSVWIRYKDKTGQMKSSLFGLNVQWIWLFVEYSPKKKNETFLDYQRALLFGNLWSDLKFYFSKKWEKKRDLINNIIKFW